MHTICVCAALTAHPVAAYIEPARFDRAVFWYVADAALSDSTTPKFVPVIVTAVAASVGNEAGEMMLIAGSAYDVVSLDAADC